MLRGTVWILWTLLIPITIPIAVLSLSIAMGVAMAIKKVNDVWGEDKTDNIVSSLEKQIGSGNVN